MTSHTPLVFVFTLRTTVSIVNVIVSSVELSVSVLTMSPRFHVAVEPEFVSTGALLSPGTVSFAGSSLTAVIVRT